MKTISQIQLYAFKTQHENMSMQWIRKTYGVPAKRGQRVTYVSEKGHKPDKVGVITSAERGYLRIRFDGDLKTYPAPFHPTWNIVYHNN